MAELEQTIQLVSTTGTIYATPGQHPTTQETTMLGRRIRYGALAAVLIFGSATIAGSHAGAAPGGQGAQGAGGGGQQDTSVALVQLSAAPVSTASDVDRGNGQRVDLNGAKTKSYRAQLSAQRNEFKQWLHKNAPKAKVTGSFDIAVNAVVVELNGTSLDTLRTAPMVAGAQFTGVYTKTADDPDLALINAVAAWGGGGPEGAGAGIKVAVIDTGIDHDHPCFDDMGDSDGPNNFTNNKVIVAKVFYNKAANLGLTPEAIDSHGTHVAGTIACDFGTQPIVDGVVIPYLMSGVAPAAVLGNYNVFPGTVADARSEDILNALEAAFADGMDVANMSLGGAAQGNQDLLTIAVDNLDRAGMVVAVSAGNEGPGFSTVGSPGSAERALTAGASSVPHQVLHSITTEAGTAEAVIGEFGEDLSALNGTIDIVEPQGAEAGATVPGISIACTPIPLAPAEDLIAVIARNVCDFSVKLRHVQDAGYVAAILVNRVDGAFVMGSNGAPDQPTIPAAMIGVEDIAVVLPPAVTAILNPPSYRMPYGPANQMADFSSQGPTDVDRRIKPDVVAPGVNVLSSVPGGGFAFFNGTSMASPHLAGAAAVVLGAHPDWATDQVRSAIVNTAEDEALTPFFPDASADDPNLTGAGLLDLAAAVNATVLLDRVSVSFGQVPKGAGKTLTQSVGITAGTVTSVDVEGEFGSADFSASTDGSTISVTATTAKQATPGPSWATVVIKQGGAEVAHFRVFLLVG
jgi:minor extracellular serine protease Vpr